MKVKKMRRVEIFFVLLIFIGVIGFVLGEILVNGGGIVFSSVDEDTVALYNFSVNNTALLESANITGVNVTLPSGFVFVLGSDGSDAGVGVLSASHSARCSH